MIDYIFLIGLDIIENNTARHKNEQMYHLHADYLLFTVFQCQKVNIMH